MKISIIVAHQDDESVGLSSYLSMLKDKDIVRLIYVTDGMVNPHIDSSPYFPNSQYHYGKDYKILRQKEALAALSLVGIKRNSVTFLDYPCQNLQESLVSLEKCLDCLLRADMPNMLITHDYEGGNIDHDIVFAIANKLCMNQNIHMQRFSEYYFDGEKYVHGIPIQRPHQKTKSFYVGNLKKKMFLEYPSQSHELIHFRTQKIETLIEGILTLEVVSAKPTPHICAYERKGRNKYRNVVAPSIRRIYR